MDDRKPGQVATVIGIDSRGCLEVRSVEPLSEFKLGGSKWGYCYEWGINKYSFTGNKKDVMEKLGLTEQEYQYWLPLITF